MYTRRSMLWTAACLLVAPAAFGQGPRGGRGAQAREKALENMKERLKLTEEQEEKIRAILEKEGEKLKAAWDKGQESGDRAAVRAEMREIRTETHKQVVELLTDEQKPEYRKMVAEAEQWRREAGRRRGDPQQ